MTDLREMGERAVAAKAQLQTLHAGERTRGLMAAADALLQNAETILKENNTDMEKVPSLWSAAW